MKILIFITLLASMTLCEKYHFTPREAKDYVKELISSGLFDFCAELCSSFCQYDGDESHSLT